MAKKAKFMRAAAEAYAIEHEIVKKPGKLSDEKLIEKMEVWFKKFAKKYQKESEKGEEPEICDPDDGGCDRFIQDADTYCWFCGNDVSEDGTGGFKEEEEEEKESEEEEEEKEEEEVSLEDRVEKILKLSRRSGGDAWEIGRELALIVGKKQYKNEKFKSFEEFSKKVLGLERGSAYSFIRIAEIFTKEDAGSIQIFKLNVLARIKDDKLRNKLIKAAKPKADGGKGMDVKELNAKLKIEREKNPPEKGSSPGRKPISPLMKLVGQKFKSSWDDDEMIVVDEDAFGGGGVGIHVRKLKKGLKFEIIELERDEPGVEGEEED